MLDGGRQHSIRRDTGQRCRHISNINLKPEEGVPPQLQPASHFDDHTQHDTRQRHAIIVEVSANDVLTVLMWR